MKSQTPGPGVFDGLSIAARAVTGVNKVMVRRATRTLVATRNSSELLAPKDPLRYDVLERTGISL